MISFLRKQMVSIITRVAEHVREVQDEVQELKRDLAQRDDKERGEKIATDKNSQEMSMVHDLLKKMESHLEQEKTAIDKNSQEVSTLHDLLKKMDCHLGKLDRDVATSKREKDRLEAEHEATKSDLVALNERHRRIENELSDVARTGRDTQCSTQQLVRDLRKAEAALPLEVGRLEKLIDSVKLEHTSRAVSNTEIKAQLFQESLDYQEDTSKKLDELISWKGQAVALMKDTSRAVADLKADLKLPTEATSDQKDMAKSFRSVEKTLNSHQVRIEQNVDVQHRHEKQLRVSENGIGQLQESLSDLREQVQLLSTKVFHLGGFFKHRNVTLSKPPPPEVDHPKLPSPKSPKASNTLKLSSRFDHPTKNLSEGPRAVSRSVHHADDHGLHRPKTPRLPDVPGRNSPAYGLSGH